MNTHARHNQAPLLASFPLIPMIPRQILLVTPPGHGEAWISGDTGLAFTFVDSPQACHEALAAHRPQVYDAVVIDWQADEASGQSLLETLRRAEYPAPVIALLPPQQPALVEAARQSGATGWLLKTADYRLHLPQVIAAAIDHARLQREQRRGATALQRAHRETLIAQTRGELLHRQLHTLLARPSEGVPIPEADEGRMVAANAAAERLIGFPSQPGQPSADHQDFRAETPTALALTAETIAPLRASRQGGAVVREEVRLIRSAARRATADDAVVRVADISHDRSEASHLAALREAVIAIASHQLKNPLTVILGYSALLLKSSLLDQDARAHRAIDKIRHESLRLRQLVDELLEFSRLELGRIALQTVPLDLAELVHAVVVRQREALRPRTIALGPAQPAPYIGDYGRLTQAVGTLVALRAASDPAASLGIALGDHTAQELATSRATGSLPPGMRYRTIAIGDAATADAPAPCPAAWRPFPALMVAEELVTELSLGLPISAALVRAHGGMLYANEARDYLVVLPMHAGSLEG